MAMVFFELSVLAVCIKAHTLSRKLATVGSFFSIFTCKAETERERPGFFHFPQLNLISFAEVFTCEMRLDGKKVLGLFRL